MYDELNPVERYFENNEAYSKEATDEFVKAYNGDIYQLSEDFVATDDGEPKNKQILVDTICDLIKRIENELKRIIERAKEIQENKETSANELNNMKLFTRGSEMGIVNVYMVDVMMNENQLYPEKSLDYLYELAEEASAILDDTIAIVTQDELVFRSLQIKRAAQEFLQVELSKPEGEYDASEADELRNTVKTYDDFIYHKLKVEAFEEKYYNPADTLEEKEWREMNHLLFRELKTKDEIIKEILLPLGSFEQMTKFMEYMFKEPEAYIPTRKENMATAMLAFTDIASYEIHRLHMKTTALTEEDNFKAMMLKTCGEQEKGVVSSVDKLESTYRSIYHPEEGHPVSMAVHDVDFEVGLKFRVARSTQMKRLFPEIKEKENEMNRLREEFEKEHPDMISSFSHSPEATEFRSKSVEIHNEIEDLLTKYADQETRGIESFLEY